MPIHGYMNANGSMGKKTETRSRSRMVHPWCPGSISVGVAHPVSGLGTTLGLDAGGRGDQCLDARQDLAPRVLLLDELARLAADPDPLARRREQARDPRGEGLGAVFHKPVGAIARIDALGGPGQR